MTYHFNANEVRRVLRDSAGANLPETRGKPALVLPLGPNNMLDLYSCDWAKA